MKKYALVLLSAVMLFSLTACSDQTGGGSPNGGNGGATGQNRQPNATQQGDAAYTLDDLIAAVKQAGGINGEPEALDVQDIGAEKGVSYGNVVFLQYDPYASRAYFDAYEANQVVLKGKTVPIGAINGPYFMVFLDGNVDQNAVKAFRSIGFGG